jgi:hypothetical protein
MTTTIRIYLYGEGWANVTEKVASILIKQAKATKSPAPQPCRTKK